MPTGPTDDIHVAVFDVNVYLTAARFVGRPFTWERFEQAAKKRESSWVPSYDKLGGDSAVALLMASRGEFVSGAPLQVWSSTHVENLIYQKAMVPDTAPNPEDRGLGWSQSEAQAILEELHDRLVPEDRVLDVETPSPPPSLGWDDGLVLASAKKAGNPEDVAYCITKDRDFRLIGDPSGAVLVLKPHEFVRLIRDSRRALGPSGPTPRRRLEERAEGV